MPWGARLIGLGNVLNVLDDVKVNLSGDTVYVVGSDVEYAVYQEFGTSKMEAQPFLFPAAREVKRDLPAIAAGKSSVEDVVKAAALEIERRAAQKAPVDTGNLRSSIRAEKIRG